MTAHRVVARFPTPEALLATPREQVLVRLKGTPRAAAVAERLTNADLLSQCIAGADAEIDALAERRVVVMSPAHAHWPAGIDVLPAGQRPLILWAYGNTAALAGPVAAVLGRTPLPEADYEAAQAFAQRLLAAGVAPAVGLRPGFDVAFHRLASGAGRPCVAVASSGLAEVDAAVRPSATALVRAGGVMLSPFAMQHRGFDHDQFERALVQAAVSRVVAAFGADSGGPEGRALAWAASAGGGAGRRAFYHGGEGPESARPLDDSAALDEAVGAAAA